MSRVQNAVAATADFIAGVIVVLGIPVCLAIELVTNLTGWMRHDQG